MEFLFEGTQITNPNLSECGRFEVKPLEYYGMAYKIALIKEVIKAKEAYKNASNDESIGDLCYPVDYCNAPFFILEKLGVDVEEISLHCTSKHYDDDDVIWYLEREIIPNLLNEYAIDVLCELSKKYSFDEDDAKIIDDLLKLF